MPAPMLAFPFPSLFSQTNGLAYFLLPGLALCWARNIILGQIAQGKVSPMAIFSFIWLFLATLMLMCVSRYLILDCPILTRQFSLLVVAIIFGRLDYNLRYLGNCQTWGFYKTDVNHN